MSRCFGIWQTACTIAWKDTTTKRAATPASFWLGLGVVLGLMLTISPARAHPHVWIDAHLDIRIENTRITGITVTWIFDEIFSFALIDEFDRDVNNIFTATEVAAVQANAFSALKDAGYFTHFKKIPDQVTHVEGFSAWIEGNRIAYSFDVPAPNVTLNEGFGISVYDETYYVDVFLDESNPVTLSGPGSDSCLYELDEDAENPIYFDLILPQLVTVTCNG